MSYSNIKKVKTNGENIMTKIPSLTALKVFNVASRVKNFSKAAEELHLTQGAVSRQIRNLEEELGLKLFNRLTRKVELTPIGKQYQQGIQEAFQIIETSTAQLYQRHSTILKANSLPSVSSYLLMPNLSSFAKNYPKIDLRLQSSIDSIDFQNDDVDIAIRVGSYPDTIYDDNAPSIDLSMVNNWRNVHREFLAEDILVPIYSPKYATKKLKLNELAVLKEQTLIHTTSRSDAWPGWFNKHLLNSTSPKTKGYLEYSHFFMSLEAAKSGLGIAIVPKILLQNNKDLIIREDLSVKSSGEYYLLCLEHRKDDYEIQAFIEWVKALFSTK